MRERLTLGRAARLRRIARLPLVSPRQWLPRVIFWVGAIGVSVVAIAFAAAAEPGGALPGRPGVLVARYPVVVAALCGLAIAGLGLLSDGQTYGTGYAQARSIVEGRAHRVAAYPVLKLAANIVSYLSGTPGGIFAPSLAVGAGLGDWLSDFVPAPAGAVVCWEWSRISRV
jgi:H+/Cl- antiporter ClcA